MKSKLLLFLLSSLLWGFTLSAQLTITPGTQFSVSGDARLTLQNTDLVNNGNLQFATNSTVLFTGNASSSISGSQPLRFFTMEIAKNGGQSVVLQKKIATSGEVAFITGFLNLNGFDLDLETTGNLVQERGDSRIIGPNGGIVMISANLNAPVNSNPGDLGVLITSAQNLGNVTIKRGHQSQNGNGITSSIFRYYDISPVNNTNLNATLRLNYFDEELNSLNENSLVFFKSENTTDWSTQSFTSRDAIANFVEKNGISSFSRWTLSNLNNPLPLLFTLFNARCDGNKVIISWKTAQEQNTSRFDIERSNDGIHWSVIGHLPASGNSSGEKSYLFTDNNPVQNAQYRIAEYDLDGRVQYTSIIRSSCTITDGFSVWPNPLHEMIFLNITTGNESQATVKIFDSRGALVKMQKSTVLAGNNQLRIDTRALSNGVYTLHADWNNGQIQKSIQIIKQ
jgi:hypothetical protein